MIDKPDKHVHEHADKVEFEVLTEAQTDRTGEAGLHDVGPQRTLGADAWYRLRKNKLALVSLIWIVIIVVASLTADLWVPQNFGSPTAIDTVKAMEDRLQPPSREHPMGTDELGRDIFARVVYGARVSLAVGVLAVGVSVIIGMFLGAFSGFYGGATDATIMRVADVFLAFPYILFAILLLGSSRRATRAPSGRSCSRSASWVGRA